MITSKNLVHHEFIGLKVHATNKKDNSLNLNGTIIDGKNGWTWDAGINLYANKNKLVALASGADRDLSNRWYCTAECL